MKFERLTDSKFKHFESSKIGDSFKVVGGIQSDTTYKGADGTTGKDCYDTETDDTGHTNSDGQRVDYWREEDQQP